ncbi:hypothetical protein BDQ94DRAFT_145681 [Aspergillus welwitschiae]|uniref:Uncharacterized protein n=1 Tax=Aspergillus welwitschiae TaxID=1341132 RepID=A0A3F3PZI0_9EURO|nr:hypothetical protein BDQ94DRAFT_145681 [Aspergillus welwitschiae]RDH32235.1 hypothetical protein BDQ94DRAFT_145681 [Aspergillus welwitschiae]
MLCLLRVCLVITWLVSLVILDFFSPFYGYYYYFVNCAFNCCMLKLGCWKRG